MQYWRPSKDRLIVIDDSKEGAGQLIDCQRQMGGYTPAGREHALVYMSCSSVTKEQREAIDKVWLCSKIGECSWALNPDLVGKCGFAEAGSDQ